MIVLKLMIKKTAKAIKIMNKAFQSIKLENKLLEIGSNLNNQT